MNIILFEKSRQQAETDMGDNDGKRASAKQDMKDYEDQMDQAEADLKEHTESLAEERANYERVDSDNKKLLKAYAMVRKALSNRRPSLMQLNSAKTFIRDALFADIHPKNLASMNT